MNSASMRAVADVCWPEILRNSLSQHILAIAENPCAADVPTEITGSKWWLLTVPHWFLFHRLAGR